MIAKLATRSVCITSAPRPVAKVGNALTRRSERTSTMPCRENATPRDLALLDFARVPAPAAVPAEPVQVDRNDRMTVATNEERMAQLVDEDQECKSGPSVGREMAARNDQRPDGQRPVQSEGATSQIGDRGIAGSHPAILVALGQPRNAPRLTPGEAQVMSRTPGKRASPQPVMGTPTALASAARTWLCATLFSSIRRPVRMPMLAPAAMTIGSFSTV